MVNKIATVLCFSEVLKLHLEQKDYQIPEKTKRRVFTVSYNKLKKLEIFKETANFKLNIQSVPILKSMKLNTNSRIPIEPTGTIKIKLIKY